MWFINCLNSKGNKTLEYNYLTQCEVYMRHQNSTIKYLIIMYLPIRCDNCGEHTYWDFKTQWNQIEFTTEFWIHTRNVLKAVIWTHKQNFNNKRLWYNDYNVKFWRWQKKLWIKAILSTAFITNKSPHCLLLNKNKKIKQNIYGLFLIEG